MIFKVFSSRLIVSFGTLFFLFSCSSEQSTLEKVENQMKRYDEAKIFLIERNYMDDAPVSHLRLEFFLGNLVSDAFSEEELKAVSALHQKIIQANADKAKRISVIDLSEVRQDTTKVLQLCKEIPKGGMLHVHPWGLFTTDIVRQILLKNNPIIEPEKLINYIENKDPGQFIYDREKASLLSFPKVSKFNVLSKEQQEKFIEFFVLPNEPIAHDFERFDSIFTFIDLMLGDEGRENKLLLAYKMFLNNAAQQGVSYVEFTEYFSPKIENIRQLENWAEEFLRETGIIVRWNVSFLRFFPAEENAAIMKEWNELLIKNPTEVITGIDILSLERGFPALEVAQDMYAYLAGFNAKNPDHPLEMTMHAGELGDRRNVRDAILMGTSRIGHGVLLHNDPITLEYARRRSLPIEINLTSNHKLGVHDMYNSPHPFLDFLRLGLQVSLSTDNDAIFSTDIVQECVAAVSTTDIEYSELKTMSYNGINASFSAEPIKQKLLLDLDESFRLFETKYNARDQN